jgi:hypothetical protein
MIIPEALLDWMVPVLQGARAHHFNITGVLTTITPEKSYPLIANFFCELFFYYNKISLVCGTKG